MTNLDEQLNEEEWVEYVKRLVTYINNKNKEYFRKKPSKTDPTGKWPFMAATFSTLYENLQQLKKD